MIIITNQNKNKLNPKKVINNHLKNKQRNLRKKYKHTYTFVTTRVVKKDRNYLYKLSQIHNISISQVIRNIIHDNQKNKKVKLELDNSQVNYIAKPMNYVLNVLNSLLPNVYRIGGNINQIAKSVTIAAKKGHSISLNDMEKLNKYLDSYKTDEDQLAKISNYLITDVELNKKLLKEQEMENKYDLKENRSK